tara:strand:- start:178 stop:1893 length:1716 start_codon:yes stop_codon:yes gene_type:complete
MKHFIKTFFIFAMLVIGLQSNTKVFAKNTNIRYSQEDISNYFSGIVSLNQNYTTSGFKYLNQVKSLKNKHYNFNAQFIRSLVLLEKFDQAFAFSKSIWSEDELFFEADLLLGIESFIKKDHVSAKKYFKRLNNFSEYNLFLDDFLGNALISWTEASKNNKEESFKFLGKIPLRYNSLINIQNAFLQCYFDTSKTEVAFENIIGGEENGFSRYNFFLANYFLYKNEITAAEILLKNSASLYDSNLLLKQSLDYIKTGKIKKIKDLYNCKSPTNATAEIFYVMANLYSTQKDYQLANFYLKISLFLNNQFITNKTLLAENFYYQKKYELSKNIYNSIKSIGSVYSWYASKSIARILLDTEGRERSISSFENEINLLTNPNFETYYEIANFYKDNEYYKESINYYSLALKNIKLDHHLIPKILDRRGTSYERMGDWENAEKDLEESLRISPDQAHVLNYLAYSWTEKEINIDQALVMLKKANELKKNDGYIIDSLGWAYYKGKNYIEAEKFLQQAVEIMPLDPIINDHYADTLWMLKKDIQARYVWQHVLSLENVEQELKDNIKAKLIFGIKKL